MALCDTQSAPVPGKPCPSSSDQNIFDGADPSKPDYIGNHPGTAFMELQFYPPGWVPWPPGNSCDAVQWCAAINIFSFSLNMNTNIANNDNCLGQVGIEPGNFAFITRSGVPHPDPALGGAPAPANPVESDLATFTPDPLNDLFMNSGDVVRTSLRDSPDGLQVIIDDLTTGERGSMTAGAGNSFGQVKYDPTGTGCTNLPYDFHPMYSTSSEHTRVPWAAHSYNIAFSDEIGHFEYCNAISGEGGVCTVDGVHDTDATVFPKRNDDDYYCFDAAASTRIKITGCFGSDIDFDGVPYQNTWPGTLRDPARDRQVHPAPVRFTSPLFQMRDTGGDQGGTNDDNGQLRNFQRIAFEADLPRIEGFTVPLCQRHLANPPDHSPGSGCVNPPVGSQFYPIYTTAQGLGGSFGDSCTWQLGGPFLEGTTNTFGGSSATEFGTTLLALHYPTNPFGTVQRIYEDYRNIIDVNPCPASP